VSATTLDQFKAWFEDVLAMLYPHRNAGIAIFMISLPLAERYLRQKSNLGPDADLNDDFMRRLVKIFSALRDETTARQFWIAYRHGFLHQVTLSTSTRRGATLPTGWLTHDIAEAIQIMTDGSFCVHPVLFSQKIISEIKGDFATFAGTVAGAPPLARVESFHPITIHSTPIGTRGG
jgi:hypothetical protein